MQACDLSRLMERPFMFLSLAGARCFLAGACALLLVGCAHVGEADKAGPKVVTLPELGPLHFAPSDTAKWAVVTLPGKALTTFKLEKQGQRQAMLANAQSSASMLRQAMHVPAERLGRLQFEWQADALIERADMAERDSEDSPLRLILAFEGDRSRFSAKNAMLSDLTEALTGEPLPYATLMYVWCNRRPVESVIVNPRTDRVRKLVVESGAGHLKQWRIYQRDVRADFVKAFGEEPGALLGMAIMSDTDNTRSSVKAWYGPIRLD